MGSACYKRCCDAEAAGFIFFAVSSMVASQRRFLFVALTLTAAVDVAVSVAVVLVVKYDIGGFWGLPLRT